jgi:predicted RNase H-like nuclease
MPFPDEAVAPRAEEWAARTGGHPTTPVVLGVDGCKAGWVGALLRDTTYDVLVASDIASLVAVARQRAPGLTVVAVDIPIGLPDDRARLTDRLARERLPPGRKSSVFPTPSRAAVEQTTHLEASAANREAVGVGLSIQAFHLVPKILDVDAFVRSGPLVTVLEVHPEVSFAEIDSACVVLSKLTPDGRAARRTALIGVGLAPPAYVSGQGYAADDLLDACAVAWTAARYAAGAAYSLPDPPETFSDGLPAAIWA